MLCSIKCNIIFSPLICETGHTQPSLGLGYTTKTFASVTIFFSENSVNCVELIFLPFFNGGEITDQRG